MSRDRGRDPDCPIRRSLERQIDPLANVLEQRAPPEARLGPYPEDDLVATPAPRPSLPGIAEELHGESGPRLRALSHGAAPLHVVGSVRPRRSRSPAVCEYVELH